MDNDESCCYKFDNFHIDSAKRRLVHLDTFVHLPPKVFDTLLTLIRNRGRVLDKEELMEAIWPDTNVEENNLTQNISAIRKALDENRGEPRYVVTIPGRGYRFVADVVEVPGNGSGNGNGHGAPAMENRETADLNSNKHSGPNDILRNNQIVDAASRPGNRRIAKLGLGLSSLTAAACLIAILSLWLMNQTSSPKNTVAVRSIAVLPFKSLTADESEQYIGTGMADALITKLSEIRQIAVRPTSSVLRTANLPVGSLAAGRELGVDYVIDGHVQRMDDRLRVTVQMIRTSDGAALWAMPFDEKFTDVFAMQDSISQQAASALQLKLTGEERRQLVRRYTENPEAYLAFVKAAYFMNEPTDEKVKQSVEYYQQAISLDPGYALAYAGLADSYIRFHARGMQNDKAKSIDLARSSVTRALEIDDTVAYAHSILGFIAFRYDWDFSKAEREYKRARELDPNYVHSWFAFYLMTVNRLAEAEEEFDRYRQARPLEAGDTSLYYYFQRKYDLAEKELRNALDINPENRVFHTTLGLVYEQKGMLKEAVSEFQKTQEPAIDGKSRMTLMAHIYAISGRKTEAKRIIENIRPASSPESFWSNYNLAVVRAGLGEKQEAIACLERAFDEHLLGPAWLSFDPRLDNLRSEPRFQNLLQRVGLSH